MCRFPKVIETPRGHKQFLLVGTSTKVLVICLLASSDLSVRINIGAPLYCLQIRTAPAMHKSKWLHARPSVDFLKLSPFFQWAGRHGRVDKAFSCDKLLYQFETQYMSIQILFLKPYVMKLP